MLLSLVLVAFSPLKAFASTDVIAEPTLGETTDIVPFAKTNAVAGLTIYASSDADNGSSIPSTSGHAWITVSNYKSTSISVGKLSGIAQYKLISVGTWGNKSEHTGLWYGLESKFVSQGAYSNRVSLSMDLTQAQLDTINSKIINGDSWSTLNNCSSFAVDVWNSVSSVKLSAGSTIKTPTTLGDSIKSKTGYVSGLGFTHTYKVYYANGTGSPSQSTQWN
ncbi:MULTISPECIES: hypothetical protein [unclassified Lysinibacillus]|uniref:hypothetical protein n=2 Tax=Lysinibacillus TaxID=400634 RepID=UPI003810098D